MARVLRAPANWPIVGIPLALMLWAFFGAPALGLAGFNSLSFYDSPYRGALPAGRPADGIATHVLVVVFDGLRVDNSREMPNLNALRARGADRVLTVGQPSFSLPGWTAIGTGAWQEQSGFATNYSKAAIDIDTMFLAARRKGLSTAIVGEQGWDQLYAGGADILRTVRDPPGVYANFLGIQLEDQMATDLARATLPSRPALMLVHLPGSDLVAHGWGAKSEQSAQITKQLDDQLGQLLALVDLSDTAVLVTSDHGHLDRGGHGGWEPEVLQVPFVAAGRGIRPGRYPDALQVDIAPTVATLLGTAIPSHSQGDILMDELDGPPALLATRAVDAADLVATRYQAMLRTIGDSRSVDRTDLDKAKTALAGAQPDDAIAAARASNDRVRAQWASAREERLDRERLTRIPIAIAVLVPFGLYAWWWRRTRWPWRVPLAGAATYLVVWNANYFLIQRDTFSLSMFNVESNTRPFLTARVTEAMLALTLAVLLVAVATRRSGAIGILRAVTNTFFLIAAVLAVQIVLFWTWWGATFNWSIPDLFFGFKYYLDVFQSTVFWPLVYVPLGLILPALALGVAWLARRIEGLTRRAAAPVA